MVGTRRDFLFSTLGFAAVSGLDASTIWPMNLTWSADGETNSSYGSGHFGTWIEDEFGLPAYRYTINQTTDSRAVTDVQPGVLGRTEHIHQVGNDRVIAIAS